MSTNQPASAAASPCSVRSTLASSDRHVARHYWPALRSAGEQRSLFVAALQSAGVPNDPAATLDELERQVRALASMLDGVQLVVAPELHLMALPPLLEDEGRPRNEQCLSPGR